MNHLAFFEIQSTNPQREVDFYKSVFGWEFSKDENLPIEYYRFEGAGIGGAILKRPTDTPPTMQGTNAFNCSFQVEDFDTCAKVIVEKGGQIAMPKFAIPGQSYNGYFLDPDNNVFGVFEIDGDAK